MLYDLDNKGGGKIIGESTDSLDTGALQVSNFVPGKTAISILSTASGAPIKVSTFGSSIDIDSVAGAGVAAVDIRSGATIQPALLVGRTVNSSLTQAAMKFLATSTASAALMEFAGGFISVTSIQVVNGGATDYALPVVVAGQVRYIPLVPAASLVGAAAF